MLLFTAIILPATITPRPVENRANYLHESVQVIILILQLTLGQSWLSINESVQTMDSQQKMINHKTPTLKNKANFQLRSDVWETNEEIPFWWCITILNYAVLLMGWKFASCNQKQYSVYHPYFKRMTKTKAYKIQWFCHFFNLNKVQPLLGGKVPNDCTRNNRY